MERGEVYIVARVDLLLIEADRAERRIVSDIDKCDGGVENNAGEFESSMEGAEQEREEICCSIEGVVASILLSI